MQVVQIVWVSSGNGYQQGQAAQADRGAVGAQDVIHGAAAAGPQQQLIPCTMHQEEESQVNALHLPVRWVAGEGVL